MPVLLGWGPYLFETDQLSYERLKTTTGGRWKDHELFGRAPAGQFLGPQARLVELSGTACPDYCDGDPKGQIAAMMAASENGEVYNLVSGFGEVFGQMRLEEADDTATEIAPDGAKRIAFSMKFKRYADPTSPAVALWP